MGFYVRNKETGELRKLVVSSTGEGACTNYELLENIPYINGKKVLGSLSLDDIGASEKKHSHILEDISNISVSVDEINRLAGLDKNIVEKITEIATGDVIVLTSYLDLLNKPSINGTEVKGVLLSSDLGLADEEHTHNYEMLEKTPVINGTKLIGEKTSEDLGLANKTHSHSYLDLADIPKINGEYISGEKTSDSLKLAAKEHFHSISDIEGVIISSEELNFLEGLDENIMSKIGKVVTGNIVGYPTSFASYADLLAFDFTTLNSTNTYLMYIVEDETRNNNSTVYLATSESNNSDKKPSYAGIGSFTQRDFSINKIDLTTEVKGKLPLNNIETGDFLTEESLTGYMKENDYVSLVNAGNVRKADEALKISGIDKTNNELIDSLNKAHLHDNENVLNLLSMSSKGDLLFNQKRIVADAPEYGVQTGRSEW